MTILFYSYSYCQESVEEKSAKMSDMGFDLMSNNTSYPLDYEDFNYHLSSMPIFACIKGNDVSNYSTYFVLWLNCVTSLEEQ